MKKLKRSQIFLIATCGLAALFFSCVLAVGMSTDHFGFGQGRESRPRNYTGTYDLDPEEAGVYSVDIQWLDGPVTVGISPDSQIHITERSEEKLDEGNQMAVSVKSGKLAVRWDGQWFRQWITLGWFGHNTKELEVLLPEGLAQDLEKLAVGNTSGNLQITGCGAETLEASTVSGGLTLTGCSAGDGLSASSVSGRVVLSDTVCGEGMAINTVSGAVEASGGRSRSLHIETVSGRCVYGGTAEELHMDTVSGDMDAALEACPEEAELNSVSGGLTLKLPEGSAFTAEYDTVSGQFGTDFTVEKNGGRVWCGTGSAEIRMNTTSGDMSIQRG